MKKQPKAGADGTGTGPGRLVTKEQEVFELLAQKLDDQEIASKLNKSLKTIQNKKSLIY